MSQWVNSSDQRFFTRSVQNAACRLQTGYKMQTEFKMQTDFCVRNEITYLLSRNNLTMSSPINNTILNSLSLSFFFSEMLIYRMVRYWFISSCGKIKRHNARETSLKRSGENSLFTVYVSVKSKLQHLLHFVPGLQSAVCILYWPFFIKIGPAELEYRRVSKNRMHWSVSCKDGGRLIDLVVKLLIKLLLIVDTFSLAAILKWPRICTNHIIT